MADDARQYGWLIEHPAHDGEPAMWWVGRGFTTLSDKAIRFARREDAAAILEHLFRGIRHLIITDHYWL